MFNAGGIHPNPIGDAGTGYREEVAPAEGTLFQRIRGAGARPLLGGSQSSAQRSTLAWARPSVASSDAALLPSWVRDDRWFGATHRNVGCQGAHRARCQMVERSCAPSRSPDHNGRNGRENVQRQRPLHRRSPYRLTTRPNYRVQRSTHNGLGRLLSAQSCAPADAGRSASSDCAPPSDRGETRPAEISSAYEVS
jgi:hypothetical protein